MSYQPGQGFAIPFPRVVTDATGAAANFDTSPAPTAALLRNGVVDTSVTVTPSVIETGVYKLAGTLPNGYTLNADQVSLVLRGSVGGVALKGVCNLPDRLDATVASRSPAPAVTDVYNLLNERLPTVVNGDQLQSFLEAARVEIEGGEPDPIGNLATRAMIADGVTISGIAGVIANEGGSESFVFPAVYLSDFLLAAKYGQQDHAMAYAGLLDSIAAQGGGGGGIDYGLLAASVWAYGDRRVTDGVIVQSLRTQARQREIVKGDAYGAGDRTFAVMASDGGEWPTTLTGRTWTARLLKIPDNRNIGTPALVVSATVTVATGDSKSLSVTLTGTQTAALALGRYDYAVVGVSVTDATDRWTVERGTIDVLANAEA